jgi:hypothetical protein
MQTTRLELRDCRGWQRPRVLKGQSAEEIETVQSISEYALRVKEHSAEGGRHRKPEVQNTRSVKRDSLLRVAKTGNQGSEHTTL